MSIGGTIFGAFAKQAAFATAITDTSVMRFFPIKAGGSKLTRSSKASDQLRGSEPSWMRADKQQADAQMPMDCYYRGLATVLDAGFACASKSTASYVIASTNKKVYFTEDAGLLTATLTEATYTAHGLAAEIASKMTTAGDTYTCQYVEAGSNAGRFVITKTDGSPTNFTLNCTTTTDSVWSTIGFSTSANKTSAATYTGDTVVKDCKTFYFIPSPLGRFSVFYVRTGVNDAIDLVEDGGSELHATIAAGVYRAGASSSEAGTLCEAIKTALDAAGAATYTVTFSSNLFTIASDGSTSLALKFQSGTNADTSARNLLGFGGQDLLDSSGALSITAGTAVYGSRSAAGTTIIDHRDQKSLQNRAMFPTSYAFNWVESDPHAPQIVTVWVGADQTQVSPVTPPSGTLNDEPGNPDGTCTLNFTLDGSSFSAASFRNLQISLTQAIQMGMTVGNTKPVKVRSSGKDGATVQWAYDFDPDNDTSASKLFSDWTASKDTGTMDITQTGLTLRGSVVQSLKIEFPAIRPIGDTPPAEAGTVTQNFNFLAQRDRTNDLPMFTVTLISDDVLVY